MRVLALGGSGGMGRFSSFAISSNPKITKVTIADLNESSAKESTPVILTKGFQA